jgi:hypothetical protein
LWEGLYLSAVAWAVSTSPFGKLRVPSIVEGLKALSQSIGEGGCPDEAFLAVWVVLVLDPKEGERERLRE